MVRLIDADAIKYHGYLEPMGNGMYVHGGIVDDKEIDAMPTIEAVPVVHGRWIDTGKSDDAGNSFYMCSVCGCGENHYPIVEVPYCWKCGAKMDEVE